MKSIKITIILLIILLNYGCEIDRFPHESISSQDVVKDPETSLDGLLNGAYAQMKGWADVMHRCGEYAGDNIMIRGRSTDSFYEFISYSRTPNNGRLKVFWDNSYKVIAQTSNIIKMFQEGKSEQIDNSLGECYFLRGMMYFYLCRAYGRPYYQSPSSNLGVPIINGTPEDMENLHLPDRSTVETTYHQAISDLKKAENLLKKDRGNIYASKEAAQALLSRVYLYMSGTYDNPNSEYAQLAVDYANKVISSPKYKLLDRANFMKYNTFKPEDNMESIFVVKRVASEFSGYDHYYGVGGMYANIGGMGWGEMYASAKYLSLLDETGRNDWGKNKIVDARASFIEPQYEDENITIEGTNYKEKVFRFIKKIYDKSNVLSGYGYVQASLENYDYVNDKFATISSSPSCKIDDSVYTLTPVDVDLGIYKINYKGEEYQGVIDFRMKLNRSYPMFYIVKCSREGEDTHLHSPVISRLGEIYLNRSEAYAKLGNYTKALEDLNTIRERSIVGGGYNSGVANSSDLPSLIDKERQLELAFQAERSYDVFRNGGALVREYPGPHNATEIITSDDYRVVYYIPQSAIDSYSGSLTQNPTK